MIMYSLGLSVLQSEFKHEKTNVKSVAYEDDYVRAGSLQDLSKWWDKLTKRGPSYGYYRNAVKSLLIVKPDKENLARKLFNGGNIKITTTGACHLGATVGSEEFKDNYVKMKVEEMTVELVPELGQFYFCRKHKRSEKFTQKSKNQLFMNT